MNKSESKYYHTACLMDEALLVLLEKKDFDYITVKEICERAGVNRSTFYLHYETVNDLLNESLSYIFSKFLDKFANESKKRVQSERLGDLFLVTPEYIVPYLEFLRENKRVFMTAIAKPGVFGVGRYFDEIYATVFEPILERFHVDKAERKYIIVFYVGGMHSIITEWIRGGCAEPLQFIAELLIKYTLAYKGGEAQ